MKKLSTYLFLLLFSFSAPSFADDISDFQIEGMSIGDSLLDYFSEEQIKNQKQETQYPSSDKFIIYTFNNSQQNKSFDDFEIYDIITIDIMKNDKKYIIEALSGALEFRDNIASCNEKKLEIEKEFSTLFKNAITTKGKIEKHLDKSGESLSFITEYLFPTKDVAQITCDDWSEKFASFPDVLMVNLMSKKYSIFLLNEAYKK
jgi:hypothetical protein